MFRKTLQMEMAHFGEGHSGGDGDRGLRADDADWNQPAE
jgi:hypothetical protein